MVGWLRMRRPGPRRLSKGLLFNVIGRGLGFATARVGGLIQVTVYLGITAEGAGTRHVGLLEHLRI